MRGIDIEEETLRLGKNHTRYVGFPSLLEVPCMGPVQYQKDTHTWRNPRIDGAQQAFLYPQPNVS
jgi:hypothetical protein